MDKLYNKLREFLLDLFFPKFCLGCQKEGTYLCDDCRALLDISEFNYCLCEANGIPKRLLTNQSQIGKCNICKDKILSGLYFALPYKETTLAKKLVHQFKYQPYLKDLAKTLASILVEHFVLSGKNTNEIWENAILAPIPLSKKKLRSRGYNQSEELAKELSKTLLVPIISNNLIKIKSTEPQMKLKKEERQKNLENAFAIKNPAEFAGKKVFLVDDVYTTGSTMAECAKVLKKPAQNKFGA